MAKRSLSATDAGIRKAKQVFQRTGWTQSEFASEIGLSTRQPIWKFFSGRAVERAVFVDICFRLDLDWEEIAGVGTFALGDRSPISNAVQNTSQSEKHPLLSLIRSHLQKRLKSFYQWMPVSLDLSFPLPLSDCYIPPVIQSVSQKRQNFATVSEPTPIPLPVRPQDSLDGFAELGQHSKIILQGQVGVGKTTTLRFLAKACLHGTFMPDKLPIYLQLSSVCDFDLQLEQQWQSYGLSAEQFQIVSQQGLLLLLIDGFDQLSGEERCRLRSQIEQWSQQYASNSILLSCRPSCDEAHFYDFKVVELMALQRSQIRTFAERWFTVVLNGKIAVADRSSPTIAEGTASNTHLLVRDFLKEWDCSRSWCHQDVTPLVLHNLCLFFLERGSLNQYRQMLPQTILELLFFRWERVSHYSGKSHESFQYLIDTLTHIAVSGSTIPHRFYGISQTANTTGQFTSAGKSSTAREWVSNQQRLRLLSQDYHLLKIDSSGQYSFYNLDLQIYLCALHYSNLSVLQAAFPEFLKSLHYFCIEDSHLLFRWMLLFTADTRCLFEIMAYHWKQLSQAPGFEPLNHWINAKVELQRHKFIEQSQNYYSLESQLVDNISRLFYGLLLTTGSRLKLLHHLSSESLTSLPIDMQRELYVIAAVEQLEALKLNDTAERLWGCCWQNEKIKLTNLQALLDIASRGRSLTSNEQISQINDEIDKLESLASDLEKNYPRLVQMDEKENDWIAKSALSIGGKYKDNLSMEAVLCAPDEFFCLFQGCDRILEVLIMLLQEMSQDLSSNESQASEEKIDKSLCLGFRVMKRNALCC